MKTTGFQLMYRLRELQDVRDVAGAQFAESLYVFDSEGGTRVLPTELARTFAEAEHKIAALQVAQARYNLAVTVEVEGRSMTLHEAVKLVGGANRLAKMWKDAAKKGTREHYGYGEPTRSREHEYARRTVGVEECLEHAAQTARWASALRQAVQLGNAVEVELNDLDAALLE